MTVDSYRAGQTRARIAELPGTFAAYDQADLRRALLATLHLYHWLAGETAA